MKRTTSEQNKNIKKLKKYIASRNPEVVEKRKEYAKDPKVKDRRRELNKERRLLYGTIAKIIESGYCFDNEGNPFKILNNRCVVPDKKLLYCLDEDRKVYTKQYKDDISLLDIPYKPSDKSKRDEEFEELLKKFVDGDPEIITLVSKKRVVTETEDPMIDKMRAIISIEMKEYSDSDTDEHN